MEGCPEQMCCSQVSGTPTETAEQKEVFNNYFKPLWESCARPFAISAQPVQTTLCQCQHFQCLMAPQADSCPSRADLAHPDGLLKVIHSGLQLSMISGVAPTIA